MSRSACEALTFAHRPSRRYDDDIRCFNCSTRMPPRFACHNSSMSSSRRPASAAYSRSQLEALGTEAGFGNRVLRVIRTSRLSHGAPDECASSSEHASRIGSDRGRCLQPRCHRAGCILSSNLDTIARCVTSQRILNRWKTTCYTAISDWRQICLSAGEITAQKGHLEGGTHVQTSFRPARW